MLDPDRFTTALLDVMNGFAPGGGYRFTPGPREPLSPTNPRDPHHDGVTSELTVGGETVAVASDDGSTYCCGVTFEAFFKAYAQQAGQPPGDAAEMRAFIADWFCPVMGHGGAATAIVEGGFGVAVAPDEARAGDFCQFWRSTDLARPSGHSVVFLAWELDGDARRIRYWSSQGATDGIGVHTEVVGEGWTLHFARVGG